MWNDNGAGQVFMRAKKVKAKAQPDLINILHEEDILTTRLYFLVYTTAAFPKRMM